MQRREPRRPHSPAPPHAEECPVAQHLLDLQRPDVARFSRPAERGHGRPRMSPAPASRRRQGQRLRRLVALTARASSSPALRAIEERLRGDRPAPVAAVDGDGTASPTPGDLVARQRRIGATASFVSVRTISIGRAEQFRSVNIAVPPAPAGLPRCSARRSVPPRCPRRCGAPARTTPHSLRSRGCKPKRR